MKLHRGPILSVAAVLASLSAQASNGQVGYSAGKGSFAVLGPSSPVLFGADFSQDGLSLSGATVLVGNQLVAGHHLDLLYNAGAAASKGKRSLFSDGHGVPGYDGALGVRMSISSITNCQVKKAGHDCEGWGYRSLQPFFTVEAHNSDLKVASYSHDTATLGRATGSWVGANLGAVYSVNLQHVVALTYQRSRDWKSTDLANPMQVCTIKRTGADTAANIVTASSCDDRYVGNLPNFDANSWRAEYAYFPRANSNTVAYGFLSTASWRHLSLDKDLYDMNFGPVVTPAGDPTQAVAAFLLTVEKAGLLGIKEFQNHAGLKLLVALKIGN